MKKYHKCEKCGKEELFEEECTKYICGFCNVGMFVDALNFRKNTQINKMGTYEEFLSPNELNMYEGIKCRNRLPGGRYCDAIPERAKEISRVICLKCNIRITDNTLEECKKEDEDILLGDL